MTHIHVSEPTIDQFLSFLAPAIWNPRRKRIKPPSWPPDAFALCAALLERCGAYRCVVEGWPPAEFANLDDWCSTVRSVGREWTQSWRTETVPRRVRTWWNRIVSARQASIGELDAPFHGPTREALLQICAAADEACYGVGCLWDFFDPEYGLMWYEVFELLSERSQYGSTLCKQISPAQLRVLPKMRTPQSGLTLRSMSHHLALCPASEVSPVWQPSSVPRSRRRRWHNLLLVPWPQTTSLHHFESVDLPGAPLTNEFAYFRYRRESSPENISYIEEKLTEVLDTAEKECGEIDGVVFPELSLHPQEFEAVRRIVQRHSAYLIAGVFDEGSGVMARNVVRFADIPAVQFEQAKHHRWCLDGDQIVRYGLSTQLSPNRRWWEGIELTDRQLWFVCLQPWLSVCMLICEDLARPDPVADIIRAVGPNLVIALLMDGPQFPHRWSARYASVLADDPGSSVLTMSSIGMVERSRDLDRHAKSRVYALWRDQLTGTVEISLPEGAAASVLTLSRVGGHREWSADGRSDEAASSQLTLTGVHHV